MGRVAMAYCAPLREHPNRRPPSGPTRGGRRSRHDSSHALNGGFDLLSIRTARLRRAPALAASLFALLLGSIAGAAAPVPVKKPPVTQPVTAPTPSAPRKAAPVPAARPDDERLDAIAAMVNDEPVLASDVEEQLFLFLQQSGMRPDSTQVDTLRRQVLDQLINTKLVVAEAKLEKKRFGILDQNKQLVTEIVGI